MGGSVLFALLLGAPAGGLSALEAIELALQHHPAIALARAEIAERTLDVAAARAPFDTALEASVDLGVSRRPAPERSDGAVDDRAIGGRLSYAHRLAWGTELGVSLSHRYGDSAGALNVLAPQFTTELRASATQPLLRGAGEARSRAPEEAARVRARAAELDLRRTIELVLTEVAMRHASAISAAEEVAIRARVLDRAEQVRSMTAELVQRGSLPEAAVTQARASVAIRRARLEAAERAQDEARAALARAILADRAPTIVEARGALPEPGPTPTVSATLARARADLRAAELRAEAMEVERTLSEDAARPSLDLALSLGLTGLGGAQNALACQLFAQPGEPPPAGCVVDGELDGYGRSWSTLFAGGYYSAGLGATLALPIVDEAARARAELGALRVSRARQALEGLHREAEADLRAAQALAARDRSALLAAEAAREASLELVKIEDARYALGSASTFDVLRAQDDLADAESLSASARAAIRMSDLRLHFAQGTALTHLGIHLK